MILQHQKADHHYFKRKSTAEAVLFFMRRVDKKDALIFF
jgi:hypothetical protein